MSATQELFAVTSKQLTMMTPPQIDALNEVLDKELSRLVDALSKGEDSLQHALMQKKESKRSGNGWRQRWPLCLREAESLAREHIETEFEPSRRDMLMYGFRDGPSYRERLRKHLEALDNLRGERDRLLQGPGALLDGEWDKRGGWSRFITVPDGHMHRGRQCHTIRATTVTYWHPELSGRSDEEAVKAHGPFLCTHCYPGAPTAWRLDPAEERAKEKAKSECPGSRRCVELPPAMARRISKYATCPTCGREGVSVTSTWKLRVHKPKGEGGK
ncbi:hypothetical protein ABT282_07195 [Streptomyces sp. NPDC000927]|uniref:hypothetical protein n=1 Tax=Streptomyces sp. NPDC000927 TaxID=3154371 RepID=UPI0033250C0E